MLSYLLFSLVFSTSWVLAVPSPQSLASDLNLIFQNNLNWTESTHHQGAILIDAQNYTDALATCSQLSEMLISPMSAYFEEDFTNALNYLDYASLSSPDEVFWISQNGGTCRTLGFNANISSAPCDASYRALCSQSAGYGVPTSKGVSSNFEVLVQANELYVMGFRNQAAFRFWGIPYANKPERWTYPTPYTGSTTINATAIGSTCLQTNGGSEDCLFLNIHTPYLPSSSTPETYKLKPVVFWIHGGAFTSGSGSAYDGSPQVSRGDVVFVSINYRLSTLGFLALDDGVTNGNYGLADQILALEWVQTYITAFGGDPNRITIAGQSAGAGSVRALMASPLAIGKYQAALPQSNLNGMLYASTYSNYYTIDEEMAVAGNAILNATGCNTTDVADPTTLACLRAYDGTALVHLPTVARYIVQDGTYIVTPQLEVNGSGPVANVHVMMGWMADDAQSFIEYLRYNETISITKTITMNTTQSNEIIDSGLFPLAGTGNTTLDTFNVTDRLATDVEFRCLDQATAVALAQHGLAKSVWVYQFNRGYNGDDTHHLCRALVTADYPYGNPNLPYMRCHSGDLLYTLGKVGFAANPFRDANDLYFQQQIVDQWTSFFRTYNPNPDPLYLAARGYNYTLLEGVTDGLWEPLTSESQTLRLLDVPSAQSPMLEVAQCDFFNYGLDFC